MTRQTRGIRPAYFTCFNCDQHLLKQTEVTEEFYGDQSDYFCNHCGRRVNKNDQPVIPPHCTEPREPRIIDLTEPMVCIVSVVVTEKMLEDGDIPF